MWVAMFTEVDRSDSESVGHSERERAGQPESIGVGWRRLEYLFSHDAQGVTGSSPVRPTGKGQVRRGKGKGNDQTEGSRVAIRVAKGTGWSAPALPRA